MREKRIKNGFTYTFLAIGGVAMLFPVIWMFFACFKTNNEIFGSLRLLPESWVIEAFVKGWKTTGTYTYAQYFINTFALVVPTTFLTLVSCSIVAYGFARFDFPGNKALFMVLKFLRGLPRDLDESAYIDGCGPFQCFMKILLPLLKPALFSAGLFQFLWTWNDFFNTNIYINTVSKFPLSLALRVSIDVTSNIQWNQVMAMALVSVIPLIILFFAAQKYFVEGIATSGLKG